MFGKSLHHRHLYTLQPIHHRYLCTKGQHEAVIPDKIMMHKHGRLISRDELYCLMQKCTVEKNIIVGRHVHCLMIISDLDLINVLGDHLIRMFSSCESLLEASFAFCKVSHPSVYTWNSIISSSVVFGESEKAFELYYMMQEEGVLPVKVTFLLLLKACANKQMILPGRLIHEQLVRNSYESDIFIGCAVIDMYAKCRNIEEGCKVFNTMPLRDVGVYGAMISLYVDEGHATHISTLLGKMLEEGIIPSPSILSSFLKACIGVDDVAVIHYYVITEDLDVELVIGNRLIEMYATFGALEDAHRVFIGLSTRNSVTWSLLISGYTHYGLMNEVLDLFTAMMEGNIRLSEVDFLCILKTCASVYNLRLGRLFHDHVIKSGFESDANIGCVLVDIYAKCKSLEEAQKMFDILDDNLNEVSWSVMIAGYVLNGNSHSALELFEKARGLGIVVNKGIILGVLRACSNIGVVQSGRWIHDQIVRIGFESEIDIASTLIDMYTKCGTIDEAHKIFDGMSQHDVVSLGAMIGGYADYGLGLSGLLLFQQMEQEVIKPDEVVYVCVLRACSCSGFVSQGRLIHHRIIKHDYESDVVIGSTLVDMYAKCGSLDEAHVVFDYLHCRDVVAWGALISGYVQQNLAVIGFDLYNKMHQEGVIPSQNIFSSLLKACEIIGSTDRGMVLHAQVVESGYDADRVIASSLIDMYSKTGDIYDASSVFKKSSSRDIVTWSAIIAGHVSCEDGYLALNLFEEMQRDGVKPDKVTCLLLLKACSMIGALGQGRLIYEQIIMSGLESDMECNSAIVAMYAKCGCLDEAHRILNKLPNPSVVTWGAILAAHASLSNDDDESLHSLLEAMSRKGTKPDHVIFLNILAACSHSGSLEEGRGFFESMRETYSMKPDTKHYNCLIDLLGRSGRLLDAQDLLHSIPRTPDIVGWLSLLSGCKTYYNTNIGLECYNAVVACDQHDASSYVLMSNLCSHGETNGTLEENM